MTENLLVRTFLAACLIVSATPLSAQGHDRRVIAVQGRASMEVAPDVVTVSVGVTSRAPQAATTLDTNSAAARRIIDHAKSFGVAPADIRTGSVNLTEAFKNRRAPDGSFLQEPDGYIANNTVLVRLRGLDRTGKFLREVIENGANRISGVHFGLAEPEHLRDELAKQAVEDARRKASIVAQASGAKLGQVVSIAYPPRVEHRPMSGEADLAVQRSMASVPVEAGVLSLVATVDVTWSLE